MAAEKETYEFVKLIDESADFQLRAAALGATFTSNPCNNHIDFSTEQVSFNSNI